MLDKELAKFNPLFTILRLILNLSKYYKKSFNQVNLCFTKVLPFTQLNEFVTVFMSKNSFQVNKKLQFFLLMHV
jgi:hypothetical protein